MRCLWGLLQIDVCEGIQLYVRMRVWVHDDELFSICHIQGVYDDKVKFSAKYRKGGENIFVGSFDTAKEASCCNSDPTLIVSII